MTREMVYSALLNHVGHCVEAGDMRQLEELGLGAEEIQALKAIRLQDVSRLARNGARFVEVRIKKESLWNLLSYVDREQKIESVRDQLIRGDAPLAMMNVLFGITKKEYMRLRQFHEGEGLSVRGGRPREPDEETLTRIWNEWKSIMGRRPLHEATPEDYVLLQARTNTSLRTLWVVTQRWVAEMPPASQGRATVG